MGTIHLITIKNYKQNNTDDEIHLRRKLLWLELLKLHLMKVNAQQL